MLFRAIPGEIVLKGLERRSFAVLGHKLRAILSATPPASIALHGEHGQVLGDLAYREVAKPRHRRMVTPSSLRGANPAPELRASFILEPEGSSPALGFVLQGCLNPRPADQDARQHRATQP